MGLIYTVKTIYNNLKKQYRANKDYLFLSSYGCSSWAEYHRRFDKKCEFAADKLSQYYHGYPHVYVFENQSSPIYTLKADYGPGGLYYGYHDALEWCKTNTTQAYRADLLRLKRNANNEFVRADLHGEECMVFAFDSSRDYFLFALKWS